MIHENDDVFIRPAEIQKRFSISATTLRKWGDSGVIPIVRYGNSKKRLYSTRAIEQHFGATSTATRIKPRPLQQEKIIYARVSSRHQHKDLKRQIEDLRRDYPDHELVSDIASGLNFKRKGLRSILERVHRGTVEEVVVMHRDRLCRYGQELIDFIFTNGKTRLVVHGKSVGEDSTRELADDLLAITTIFVAHHNGQRSAANKRKRRVQAQMEEAEKNGEKSRQSTRREGIQDAGVPHKRAKTDFEEVDGSSELDLQQLRGSDQ